MVAEINLLAEEGAKVVGFSRIRLLGRIAMARFNTCCPTAGNDGESTMRQSREQKALSRSTFSLKASPP